jgi:hypothetical protein
MKGRFNAPTVGIQTISDIRRRCASPQQTGKNRNGSLRLESSTATDTGRCSNLWSVETGGKKRQSHTVSARTLGEEKPMSEAIADIAFARAWSVYRLINTRGDSNDERRATLQRFMLRRCEAGIRDTELLVGRSAGRVQSDVVRLARRKPFFKSGKSGTFCFS